jgi:hypothetical protein
MKGKPTVAGFLSYVHADDDYEKDRISKLRERLEQLIRFHSGLREFSHLPRLAGYRMGPELGKGAR